MSYWRSLLSLSDCTAHSKAIMLKDKAITTSYTGESIVCRLCNCAQLHLKHPALWFHFWPLQCVDKAFYSSFPAAGGCWAKRS